MFGLKSGVRAFLALLLLTFSGSLAAAAPGGAPPAGAASASSDREGAAFISGEWSVRGAYEGEESGSVDFSVTFANDGTFVDRDGYRGRWVVYGSSFSMFYPDGDLQLGYAGMIDENGMHGRFESPSLGGAFTMTPIGPTPSIVGEWRGTHQWLEEIITDTWTFRADGTFVVTGESSEANGTWTQSGSQVRLQYESGARPVLSGTLNNNVIRGMGVLTGYDAARFEMARVSPAPPTRPSRPPRRLRVADVVGEWRVIGGTGCVEWQRIVRSGSRMVWEYSYDDRQNWIENEESNGRYRLHRDALDINGRRILERRADGEFWIVSRGPGGDYNCHVTR